LKLRDILAQLDSSTRVDRGRICDVSIEERLWLQDQFQTGRLAAVYAGGAPQHSLAAHRG